MDIGFTIPPKYKIRDRLNKRVISKLNPELARQKMLTGVPCEELTIQNLYKFYPIVFVYMKKMAKILSQQIFNRTIFIDKSLSFPKHEWYRGLFSNVGESKIGRPKSWVSRKMYDSNNVNKFFNNATKPGFRYYGELEKMITLELRLRDDNLAKDIF